MRKNIFQKILVATVLLVSTACTNLDETTYDIIPQNGFYKTKENVIQGFLRPFGHAYWLNTQGMYWVGELSADHYMTVQREEHWYNGGEFCRYHYHTWTIDDGFVQWTWNDTYRGIGLCNSSISDLSKIDGDQLGLSKEEIDDFIAQSRVLRAWMYMSLFDLYHNIPIVTDYPISDLPSQSTPEDTFAFLETELLEALPKLNVKAGANGNGINQGLWTQGACAALLARLYMNASWWIDKNMETEAAKYCEAIIRGDYGFYESDSRWDAPFDWDNVNSNEILYGFPSSYGGMHWVYGTEMFWQVAPFLSPKYFGFTDWGNCNPKYALQPGLDLEGNEYTFDLGKPVRKFMNYPDDVRLKKYKNLGNSKREGMFLYGYLPYEENGEIKNVTSDNGAYELYIRDQVGVFRDTDPSSASPKPSNGAVTTESKMTTGDQNSGWCIIKYPFYPSNDANKIESDYAMLRLPEIIYYLAEIRFNQGNKAEAERLLNTVRKRNYPANSPSLYPEDGSVITKQELLDEWGREFLAEGLRRQTLCRFGVYNTGRWWDKEPDADNHTMWLPLSRTTLNTNPNLKQNPGYPEL